jgi:Flp pilus assembly protein TadD
MAFAVQGHVASYLHKNFDMAFNRFETALRVNPNGAPAWVWSAAAHAWIGNGCRAIEEINRAMALSPYDPLMYAFTGIAGVAFLAGGQYERAVECGLRCMRENKTYTSAYKLLVIALVLAGRETELQAPLRQLMDLDPEFTVMRFRNQFPGSGFPHGELYCDALSRAGVPLG